MTKDEPSGEAPDALRLKRAQPAGIRVWHWANALVVLGLLGTVLLRKTFLSWRTNAAMIQAKGEAAGVALPADLANSIAKGMRDAMWEWHHALGYALGTLLVARVIVAVVTGRSPLRDAIRGFQASRSRSPGADKAALQHFALVSAGYAAFYLSALFMVSTGLVMLNAPALGLAKGTVGSIKELHETMMWFFALFVGVHVAGVVGAELTKYGGIVSDMIHGGKARRPS